MENDSNKIPENTPHDGADQEKEKQNQDQVPFENPDVDPGFESSEDNKLTGRDDKRSGNIDSDKSISEMREEFDEKENDALNRNNDREHGAYNPKNI